MVTTVKPNGRAAPARRSAPGSAAGSSRPPRRRTPSRSSRNWPSGSSARPVPRERRRVRPDQAELLQGVGPALQADQDVGEEVADLGRPGVAGRVLGGEARSRGRRPRRAGPRGTVPPGPSVRVGEGGPHGQRLHQRARQGVLGGPLGEVEALAVRAVPGGREVLQGGGMAAVVVRGAAHGLLPTATRRRCAGRACRGRGRGRSATAPGRAGRPRRPR